MKKIQQLIIVIAALVGFAGCDKSFLERKPQGQLTDDQLGNRKAVEWMLIGAYGSLNGNRNGTWGNYASAPSQWLFGDVAADNAHKGSSSGDQAAMSEIELHTPVATNEHLTTMWTNCYEGVIRCNATLKSLKALQEGDGSDKFTEDRAKELEAEARLLRAHYYFFLWRVFVNVPYIDENTSTADASKTPNDTDIYPKIIEDLVFANANLTTKPFGEVGRVDLLVAKSYLAKVYMYAKRFDEALPLLKDVIAARPSLVDIPFQNNFDVKTENGPESIFAVQHVINPDGAGDNANVGDMLSGFYGNAPANCCGFFQPSFDLANAFRVTPEGLPMLDGSFRTNPYKSDMGLSGTAKDNYAVNQSLPFDTRIDYTLGRRGVPYRDWGVMPGDAWIRDPAFGGPFVTYKQMIDQADFPGNTQSGANYVTSLNVNLIRLADVYLLAAECAAEADDLDYALARVNDVRNRAAKLPPRMINGTPAAAYKVSPYPAFPNKTYALDAIRFERRLELALEGHRFFDLVRWGIFKEAIESYSAFEGSIINVYGGVTLTDRNRYFPIPQQEIDRSSGALTQNSGY